MAVSYTHLDVYKRQVLVWGASGGLGVFATQLCAVAGANAIGVISDETKRDFVLSQGAKAVLNRKDFNCWGQLPPVNGEDFSNYMKAVSYTHLDVYKRQPLSCQPDGGRRHRAHRVE